MSVSGTYGQLASNANSRDENIRGPEPPDVPPARQLDHALTRLESAVDAHVQGGQTLSQFRSEMDALMGENARLQEACAEKTSRIHQLELVLQQVLDRMDEALSQLGAAAPQTAAEYDDEFRE